MTTLDKTKSRGAHRVASVVSLARYFGVGRPARHRWPMAALIVCCLVAALPLAGTARAATWRGLTVAPEESCSPYDRQGDYRHRQSIKSEIVRLLGAVHGPYTGDYVASGTKIEIEHIVATREAHDSGLCAQDMETRKRFAEDPHNLTLASQDVNRRKGAKDAADWLPQRNQCWFANRILEVRLAYGLTIDRREADVLERILVECKSTALEPFQRQANAAPDRDIGTNPGGAYDVLVRYDDNRNGRITCKEAHRHGIAPVPRDHPAYRYMRDGDNDGIVCE